MAIIRKLDPRKPARVADHSEAEATWSIVEQDGEKLLQIDIYNSAAGARAGKPSQSTRFSGEALELLRRLAKSHFTN